MATSPAASSSSAPTASAAAAATMAAEATDGPVLSVVSKRLRALRKKYNRITQMEESLAAGKTLNREQEEVLRSKPVVAALIDELERLCPPLASALTEELFSPTRCLMQCGNYFTATPSASASSSSQTLAHCMTGFPPAINESCSREKIQSRYITTINPVHSMGVVLQFLAIDAYWVLMGFESVANHVVMMLEPLSGNVVDEGPWPPPLSFLIQGDTVQFRPTTWPPHWLSFDPGPVFKLEQHCSSKCVSLQHALPLLHSLACRFCSMVDYDLMNWFFNCRWKPPGFLSDIIRLSRRNKEKRLQDS